MHSTLTHNGFIMDALQHKLEIDSKTTFGLIHTRRAIAAVDNVATGGSGPWLHHTAFGQRSDAGATRERQNKAGTKNPRRSVGFCTGHMACLRWLNPSSGSAALDSSAKTLVEAFYAATSARLLLLARVEGVAVGAYVQREVLTRSRTNLEAGTARAVGGDRVVIRVDTLFHLEPHELYAAT